MNEYYVKLFKEVLFNCEVLSEKVMDYNKEHDKNDEYETANKMRNDFANLHDRMEDPAYVPTKNDYIVILAATYITAQNLEDHAATLEKVAKGYRMEVIPRLTRIIDETQDDEGAKELAEKIFQLNN